MLYMFLFNLLLDLDLITTGSCTDRKKIIINFSPIQSSNGRPDQHSEKGEGRPSGWPSGQCQSKLIQKYMECIFLVGYLLYC